MIAGLVVVGIGLLAIGAFMLGVHTGTREPVQGRRTLVLGAAITLVALVLMTGAGAGAFG